MILMLAATLSMTAASCSSGSKSESADSSAQAETAFTSEQPLASGEYRADSFQYADGKREPFDGRLIMASKPGNSGIYIYENGNRTNFTARLLLGKDFEKSDTVYVAQDMKGKTVEIWKGAVSDTIRFEKGGKSVKVAFEGTPMKTYTPDEAWTSISNRLEK